MAETRSTAAMATTNKAIASLRATSDHHNKNIQEIQKIHTRPMNEMNQHLMAILQKLGSNETGEAKGLQLFLIDLVANNSLTIFSISFLW